MLLKAFESANDIRVIIVSFVFSSLFWCLAIFSQSGAIAWPNPKRYYLILSIVVLGAFGALIKVDGGTIVRHKQWNQAVIASPLDQLSILNPQHPIHSRGDLEVVGRDERRKTG